MIPLIQKVTCPSCWHEFAPADSLWISTHPDLHGDDRLGDTFQRRFLPERFSVGGYAYDSQGSICQELACPNCHLNVPRSSLELNPFFISIAGKPSCGKTYFLASMTWMLRQNLPKHFAASLSDSDSIWNKVLNDYEEQQFFNPENDSVVRIAKTEEQGDLYSTVSYNDQTVTYPKPFLFDLRPLDHHPNSTHSQKISRQICVYDNAGESFEPGKDTVINAVTKHLGTAECFMFCFDPTQDPRFRAACQEKGSQLAPVNSSVTARQETVFHEMVKRIRRYGQKGEHEKTSRPIIVVCTKYDAWWPLLGHERFETPIKSSKTDKIGIVDLDRIKQVSNDTRELIFQYAPDLVTAAEAFSNNVYFIPVSATGGSIERNPESGSGGVRPKNINPMWCEVPFLIAMCQRAAGMIPYQLSK